MSYLLFLIIIGVQAVHNKRIPIKVIQEPVSYGFYGNNGMQNENSEQLIARVKYSNFSGPLQFKALVEKCFNLTDDQYRYVLCPFRNLTQHELALRWNAYQGILGIWQEWEIINNTFSAMVYSKGDLCGDIERSAKTPLSCHKDAMLVYPRLPDHLRHEWDILETELALGDITKKGYDTGLKRIYQKAGLQKEPVTEVSTVTPTTALNAKSFHNLEQCNVAYRELLKELDEVKKEIESLQVVLDLKNVKGKGKNEND